MLVPRSKMKYSVHYVKISPEKIIDDQDGTVIDSSADVELVGNNTRI